MNSTGAAGDATFNGDFLEDETRMDLTSWDVFQKFAGAAEVARDWPLAVARWQEARARWPDRWEGFTGGASALLQLGELDAAEELIIAGEQQHPDIFWLRLLRARAITARRDFETALPAWALLRDTWPNASDGYFGGASCLRELGRYEEADAILCDGIDHLPDNAGLAIDYAALAERRADWPEADSRWRALRQRLPGQIEAYLRPALRAREQGRFDDAETVLAEGILHLPDRPELYIEYARTAERRDAWPQAGQLWSVTRARFPQLRAAWNGEIAALKAARQHDAALRVTAEAMDRFPDEPSFILTIAWDAVRRRDLNEALAAFAKIRQQFPQEPAGYHAASAMLRQQNRFQEADAVIALGLTHTPLDPAVGLEYAWCGNTPARLAEHGLAEGIRRLERLRSVSPEYEAGYVLGARWLRESGRHPEAKALAEDAMRRFPGNVELVREHASLNHTEAERAAWIETFRHNLDGAPHSAAAAAGLALMLMGADRPVEAEAALQQAKTRLGPSVWIAKAYAECAEQRGDWAEAVHRWVQAEAAFPGDAAIAFGVFRARTRLADEEPGGHAESPTAGPAKAMPEVLSTRALMMQFESMGADPGGCEFGLVQREFNAEPLGLLRWATITAANLTLALNERFAGVGDPENTELTIHPSGLRSEYTVADRRYGMMMHTFVYTDEVPFDRMFQQICRRLAYLRRKLLDDLAESEKIFVWRRSPVNLSDRELDDLYAAMRRYGDNALLYVRYNDADHPAGEVEKPRPGLLVGYVDRFIMARDGTIGSPATQTWLKICQNAYQRWRH
jgi:tetratricopeptide (TPR) repeat protein